MLEELLFSNDTTLYCETSHRVFHFVSGTLFAGTDILRHWTEIAHCDGKILGKIKAITNESQGDRSHDRVGENNALFAYFSSPIRQTDDIFSASASSPILSTATLSVSASALFSTSASSPSPPSLHFQDLPPLMFSLGSVQHASHPRLPVSPSSALLVGTLLSSKID